MAEKEKKISIIDLAGMEAWADLGSTIERLEDMESVDHIKQIIDEGVRSAVNNYGVLTMLEKHLETRRRISDALLGAVKIVIDLKITAEGESVEMAQERYRDLRLMLEEYYRETQNWRPGKDGGGEDETT